MPFMRSHHRSTQTAELAVTLTSEDSDGPARPVINLSEGGMLIAGAEPAVGAVATFELDGPDFRYTGLAEARHQTDEATGLQFVRWDRPGERKVRAKIAGWVRDQHHESAARSVPGGYLG